MPLFYQVYKLPSGQDIEKDSRLAPDLEVLKQRIRDIMQVRDSASICGRYDELDLRLDQKHLR